MYAITHTATGRRYVGSSADLVRRQQLHWRHLRQGGHHSPRLQHAFNKYGRSAFEFTILERIDICEPDQLRATLRQREQYHMDASTLGLLNASPCSESRLGMRMTEEAKARLRVALGDPDVRQRMSEAKRAQHACPIFKEKFSRAIQMVWSDPETHARMKAAIKRAASLPEDKARRAALCASPEYRSSMSAAVRKSLARPEVREKISAATKAALARPEIVAKMSAAGRARHARPDEKIRHAAATRAALARPEVREKMLAKLKEIRERPRSGERHAAKMRAYWSSPAGMARRAKAEGD